MEFEWDEQKRLSNLAKHGLDFADVAQLDWSVVKIFDDRRFDYGEDRLLAFARLDGQLYSVAFTMRGPAMRILSFRSANRTERKRHG